MADNENGLSDQVSAGIWDSAGRTRITGTVQLIDDRIVDVFAEPIRDAIVDTGNIDPLKEINLDLQGGSMGFSNDLIHCDDVFYFEDQNSTPVDSSSFTLFGGISNEGSDFRLDDCAARPDESFNNNNTFNDNQSFRNFNDNETVQLSGTEISLQSSNRQFKLVNGGTIDLGNTVIEAVIYDEADYYRQVPLSFNNSFGLSQVPCLDNIKWYYQTSGSRTPLDSAEIQPGSGVQRDDSGENFITTSCFGAQPTSAAAAQVSLQGNQIQLQTLNGQVQLVDGSLVNPLSNPLDAVIYSPNDDSEPAVILPLGANLTFVKSALTGGRVWFYQRHDDQTAVDSSTITPSNCVSRDASGDNFQMVCN